MRQTLPRLRPAQTGQPSLRLSEGDAGVQLRPKWADRREVDQPQIPWRPLGKLLVEKGLLTDKELEQALGEQAKSGRRLGEIIVERGYVSRPVLTNALAEQYGIVLQTESGFGTGLRSEIERRQTERRPPLRSAPPSPEIRVAVLSSESRDRLERQDADGAERRREADSIAPPAEREATDPSPTSDETIEYLLAQIEERDARLAELAPRLEEQWAKLAAAEAMLEERDRELAELKPADESRQDTIKRLLVQLEEREARLAEVALEAKGEAMHVEAQETAVSHLLFVPTASRYLLVEQEGAPPLVGTELELAGICEDRLVVSKLTRSPLPLDRRPCAYLQRLQ